MMKARAVFKTGVFRKFGKLFPAAGTTIAENRTVPGEQVPVRLITVPNFSQTGTSGQWSPYLTGSVQY